MQNILIDLGNSSTSLFIKDKLIIEDKSINIKNITYQDIKKMVKRAKKRVFNSKIELLVLDKDKVNLPKKVKVFNKQERSLLEADIDINRASATTLIYVDNSFINLSIYSLGKMIFNKTMNTSKKDNLKKIIYGLDEEILSSIKERGIILTGNINLDNIHKELRKELNIPIFMLDNKKN